MLIICYDVTCDAERMYFQCLSNMGIDLDQQADKKRKSEHDNPPTNTSA